MDVILATGTAVGTIVIVTLLLFTVQVTVSRTDITFRLKTVVVDNADG